MFLCVLHWELKEMSSPSFAHRSTAEVKETDILRISDWRLGQVINIAALHQRSHRGHLTCLSSVTDPVCWPSVWPTLWLSCSPCFTPLALVGSSIWLSHGFSLPFWPTYWHLTPLPGCHDPQCEESLLFSLATIHFLIATCLSGDVLSLYSHLPHTYNKWLFCWHFLLANGRAGWPAFSHAYEQGPPVLGLWLPSMFLFMLPHFNQK